MQSYPYDWKGTNPENAFTEDRIVEGELPEDRVVILHHRPFFGNQLVVTPAGGTTPLTPGTDYQLVYQLTELDDSVASSVYCGVQLLNPAVGGALRFTGQHLGDTFYSPFVDILDELVKYLNNPVDVDWLKLENRPTLYPPQPAATSWADLLNKKYLASAVRDVELDAGTANAAIRSKLAALKNTVNALAADIAAFNYPAHIANHKAHNITLAQTGAHPLTLKTPDTFLAYGKTLRQLTAEIRALGLQQADIDKYIEKWACKDVTGTFVQQLAPNRSLFKSQGGQSEITFTDTAFVIKSNGSVILSAGYDPADTTLRFMEWKSGVNTLRIESSGSALGMDKLTLNGKVLLTTNLLLQYQATDNGGAGDPDDNKLWVEGRNGLAFTGKGSKADPVKGTLTPPKASTTVKGVAKLKSGPGTETAGVAATPNSLTPYEGKANEYVLKSTMINSVAMDTGTRTLNKADVGLGNVDNTADLAKPISQDQQAVIDGLSPTGHTHTWDELGLTAATSITKGLARYTMLPDGLAGQKGVTPSILKELSDRLDIIAAALTDVKPGTTAEFAAINASNWTVSGTKRGMSVQDLGYFYLQGGNKANGVVSGSVDFQTTPMFNWFMPTNTMEKQWPLSVLNTGAGVSFTGISATPKLPLNAVPVGLTANGMGALSVVSLLAKERVVTQSGSLDIYVAGGGVCTVYVDGREVATGNSPLHVVAGLEAGNTAHTVGIRVDCNDATKAAALMYEIWDESVPLCRSEVGKPIAQLQEFVLNADGLRHYLYLNMITGSLFSRAEPVESQGIDINFSLVGYVDVPVGGLTVSKIAFGKMFDYGASKEISAHIARKDVHVPQRGDWRLSDNPAMLPMGKMRFVAGYAAFGTRLTFVDQTNMLLRLTRAPGGSEAHLMWETPEQSPAQWLTPMNPKANSHPTFEGGLLIDVRGVGARNATLGYNLVFVGKRQGPAAGYYRNRYLRIPIDGVSLPKIGYANGIVPLTTGVNTTPTLQLIDAPCGVTLIRTTTYPDKGMVSMGMSCPKSVASLAAIRYRYDCTTRTLRVLRAAHDGVNDGITVSEVEYQFEYDLIPYMGGFTGVTVPSLGPTSDTITALPTLHDLSELDFDDSNYHYYRSLFESYMDAGINAVETGSSSNLLGAFGRGVQALTEGLAVPVDSGIPFRYHDHMLPLAFFPDNQNMGVPLPQKAGMKWFGAPTDASAPMHRTPIGFEYKLQPTYLPGKIEIDFSSTLTGTLLYGTRGTNPGGMQAVTDGSTRTYTYDLSGQLPQYGLSVFVQLSPPTMAFTPLKLAYTIRVYDTAGQLVETFTQDNPPTALYAAGNYHVIMKRTPFHLTTVAWEWLLAKMAAERAQDGTDFGHWA